MTARVPAVYDAKDVDEMAAGQLTVLAEARRRLVDYLIEQGRSDLLTPAVSRG